MTEGSSFSKPASTPAADDLAALDRQIKEHEEAESSRSVLGWLVSQVYRGDENSLSSLKKLSQEAHEARQKSDHVAESLLIPSMRQSIDNDRDKVGWQDEISRYGSGGLKTAALFLGSGPGAGLLKRGGWIGMAATVGLYGLDNVTMKDSLASGAENFALGGLKGGLLRGTFQAFNKFNIQDIGVKGAALGLSSRIIDMGLTPGTYLDKGTGESSFSTGLRNIGANALDIRALATDAILFSSAHYIAGGANWLSGGAVNARPFYNTVMTSSAFGLSNGAYAELQRQKAAGEDIDYGKIFKRALIQGGVDAIAGVPGGLHADPTFRRDPLGTVSKDLATSANNLGLLQDRATESVARLAMPLNAGPSLAFAMATEGSMPSSHLFGLDGGRSGLSRPYMAMQAEANASKGIDKVESSAGGKEPLLPAAEKLAEKVPELPGKDKILAAASEGGATQKQVTGFEYLLAKASVNSASTKDVETFYAFMQKNTALDAHAARIYLERYESPAVRTLLEGFYKPSVPGFEPSLENPRGRQAYDSLVSWMQQPMVLLAPSKVVDYLNHFLPELNSGENPVDIRPALDHFARTSNNPKVVKVLDEVLGTKYEPLLKFHETGRSLPLEKDALVAAREEARYIWGVKTGTIKPPAQIPSALPEQSGSRGALSEGAVEKLAGASVKPRAFAAPEANESSQEQGDAQVKAAAASGIVSPENNPEVVARAIALRDQAVGDLAKNLTSADATSRQQATRELAKYLDHPSSTTWFEAWRQQAADSIYLGTMLNTPSVSSLPSDVVRQFLAAENTALPSPTGAQVAPLQSRIMLLNGTMEAFGETKELALRLVELGTNNQQALRDILYKSGHPKDGEAYRAMLKDRLAGAVGLSELASEEAMRQAKTLAAFKDTPEVGRKLIELSSAGQIDLESIMHRLGHPKFGEQFKALVAERVAGQASSEKLQGDLLFQEMQLRQAYADSPETVDRLLALSAGDAAQLQAVLSSPRERGVDRAYKALVKELSGSVRTLDELQQVTSLAKSGNAEAAFEAAKALRPSDDAAWMRVQRLIYATATGDASAVPQTPRPPLPGKTLERKETSPVPVEKTGTDPLQQPVKGAGTNAAGLLDNQTGLPTEQNALPNADNTGRSSAAVKGDAVEQPVKEAGDTTTAVPDNQPRLSTEQNALPSTDSLPHSTGEVERQSAEQPLAMKVPEAPKEKGPDQLINDLVGGLSSPEEALRQQAASQLSKYLLHPSAAQWFDAWRQMAPQSVNMGFYLDSPQVSGLPSELVQRFLTSQQTPQIAESPGGRDGTRARPATTDSLQNRLVLLNDVLETFADKPEVAQRLLSLGADNQAGLRDVLYKLGHREHGETYRAWLVDRLPDSEGLAPLTGKTAFDQARILKAFANAPQAGQRLSQLAGSGNLDLQNILYRLNNPFAGETYKDLLASRVNEQTPPEALTGDSLFLEAQAQRALGDAPDVVTKLTQLGALNPRAMQDVLMGPRDRRLEPGYKELIKQLVPGATSIEQIQEVSAAVRKGNQDAAFAAASAIRPAEQASWLAVQKLIHALSTGDAGAIQALSRQRRAQPPGRDLTRAATVEKGNGAIAGGQDTQGLVKEGGSPPGADNPAEDAVSPANGTGLDKSAREGSLPPRTADLEKALAQEGNTKDVQDVQLHTDRIEQDKAGDTSSLTARQEDTTGSTSTTTTTAAKLPPGRHDDSAGLSAQHTESFRQRQNTRKGSRAASLDEQMSAFEQQQRLEELGKQEQWEQRKSGKGKRGGGRSRDDQEERYSGKDWRKWLDEDE